MEDAAWARDVAGRLLAEALPVRWAHTRGVARAAGSVGRVVGADAGLLVCAAWLHDIGYSPTLAKAGFHPLDGARYLRDVEQADVRLCRLVAHHSGAVVEAGIRGLAGELVDEFPAVGGLVADALTYCDLTTSPRGEPVSVQARLSEIIGRYGAGSVVANSIEQARGEIERSKRVVEAALAQRRD